MNRSYKTKQECTRSLLYSAGGFTLIEILVVIGMIALLAAIVLIAINPARQFAQGRDAQRNSDLNAIINAVGQRMADGKGVFAGGGNNCPSLPSSATTIDNAGSGGGVNFSCLVPTYISALPKDPSNPVDPSTGYQIMQDANGRVHVIAAVGESSIPRTAAIELAR